MSGSNDASFLVLGDSSWTSIVTQFEITRDMRLNTIYDFINDAERFTCDGSRCTLYLNTGLDVIDYFDIDADYVGGCSLYVSQQFMYYKLTGASDNEWYRDTGVIHLHVRRISDSNVWRVHVCSGGFPNIFLKLTCHAMMNLYIDDCVGLRNVCCMGGYVNNAGQERAKVNNLIGNADEIALDVKTATNENEIVRKVLYRTNLNI